MAEINKATLTEADIISKYLLPAIKAAGWDDLTQVRQEVKLRDGKVVVRGQMAARKKVKSADIVLYHKMGLPLAVIEAKANKHEIGKGMQQGLDYARLLDVPFTFASNGDGFVFHDKTNPAKLESEIALEDFPSPGQLWDKLCTWKGYPGTVACHQSGLLLGWQRQISPLLPAAGHQQDRSSHIER